MGPDVRTRIGQTLTAASKANQQSWRLDEPYIKVKGQERYLYRAVDSTGQTIDFLLTSKRDAAAAKRFFRRALAHPGNLPPRVINVDKNRAYPPAVEGLKEDGTIRRGCRLRQCKHLNNIVEHDHRRLAKGYGSVRTAWRTLRGIEAMDMIRKGRVRRVAKGDTVAQMKFVEKLFVITA